MSLESGQHQQRRQEWVIYDVGGSRTQRGKHTGFCFRFLIYLDFVPLAAWVPFFDNGKCAASAEPNKRFITAFKSCRHHIRRTLVRIQSSVGRK